MLDLHRFLVYRLDQYVPDAFYEMYEVMRDGLITYLIKFGIIGGNAASTSNKLDSARECISVVILARQY
jgi:hypothetical protein